MCACVCVYVSEKTEQFSVQIVVFRWQLATAGLSGVFPTESYWIKEAATGMHRSAPSWSFQLSSLLKHMLNLQSNILPCRGTQHFSVNQAALTQKPEHILLRPSRHRCLKHFPRISKQGLLVFDQNRSHQMQNSTVGENADLRGRWNQVRLCCVSWDKWPPSLSPFLIRHRGIVRINQGKTGKAFSLMSGTL